MVFSFFMLFFYITLLYSKTHNLCNMDKFYEIIKSPIKVVYMLYIGKTIYETNKYNIMLSIDTEKTWAEGWENKPACLNRNLKPEDDMYEYIIEFDTEMKFDLVQDNSCYSMQDCRDKVVALASESLDGYDEYPEDGRVVIHFGDSIDEIEEMLSKRGITFTYKPLS